MLRIINFLTLFVIFLSSCEDAQIEPKEYPYLFMNEVIVSDRGAQFVGEVIDLGTEPIVTFGFVWDVDSEPVLESGFFQYGTSTLTVGNFSLEITSGLVKDQEYFVRPFVTTKQFTVYGTTQTFTSLGSLPPEIFNFEPNHGPIGTSVIITGSNFGETTDAVTVYFGDYAATVDSIIDSKIYTRVPNVAEPGAVAIEVVVGEHSARTNDLFDLYFPWRLIQGIQHSLILKSPALVIGSEAYIFTPGVTLAVKFDTERNKLEYIDLPENSGNAPKVFNISTDIFVLLDNHFWKFDTQSQSWEQKADFPEQINDPRYAFSMSFDQQGYIGFCYRKQGFWSYDPNDDQWVQRSDFPGSFPSNKPVWGNFSFTINHSGYLGVSQTSGAINTLWKYNPSSDSWESKTALPSNAFKNYATFVINGEAYVGLGAKFTGRTSDSTSDEIWKYNAANDSWEAYQNCPKAMAAVASFGVGGKGYVFAGLTNGGASLTQIWEFDPSQN